MHTNHIKDFADKCLQKEIHPCNGVVGEPVKALAALTGFRKDTIRQALNGKKNSNAQIKIIELLEIIIANDEAKMNEIRNIANNK